MRLNRPIRTMRPAFSGQTGSEFRADWSDFFASIEGMPETTFAHLVCRDETLAVALVIFGICDIPTKVP